MDRESLRRALGSAVASLVLMVGAGAASAAVDIALVPVGNMGNAADLTTGNLYGSVAYAYNIGKYEVTAGQYKDFLNAVAATDTYALYNTNMSNLSNGSGIVRSGSSGSYTYTVASDFVNRPVNYVSFWDSCRFANWLNNGQKTAAQDTTTTEHGAYSLNGVTNPSNASIARNAGATWMVTSEDEWYKAAYYNPVGGSYYMYPTSSNTAPGRDMADPRPGNSNANYYPGSGTYPIDNGHYTTITGEFQNSASPYGTFDQGGNVWEWNEAIIGGSGRGLRGGSFDGDADFLRADRRYDIGPTSEYSNVGFRVSQVPEPASLGVLGLCAIGMLARRRGAGR